MIELHEVFHELDRALRAHPGKLRGFDGIYQFVVNGVGGGQFFFFINAGHVEMGMGEKEKANITITINKKDLIEIYNGQMDGMFAFLKGKVQVRGDLVLSSKLPSLWRYLMDSKPKK